MAISSDQSSEAVASREVRADRLTWLSGALLLAVAAAAWIAVVLQAANMQAMPGAGPVIAAPPAVQRGMGMAAAAQAGTTMPAAAPPAVQPGSDMPTAQPGNDMPAAWTLAGLLAFLAAWGVMMTAMMLPSATPMIALYGTVLRNLRRTDQAGIPTPLFALVYLILWLATGIPVYLVSVAIGAAVGARPEVAALMPYALALAVVAAGIYQFSPFKWACLRVCSTPLGFLLGRWRGGYVGTSKMALEHAAFCIGCCWGLMLVLVAVGAMSLPWVLVIAAAVFVEKILPDPVRTARILGVMLVVLGLFIALQPGLAATLRGPGM